MRARVYTIQADVNVEVTARDATEARSVFEAHIKALDPFAQIEIGEEGVYTWTSFPLAPRDGEPADGSSAPDGWDGTERIVR